MQCSVLQMHHSCLYSEISGKNLSHITVFLLFCFIPWKRIKIMVYENVLSYAECTLLACQEIRVRSTYLNCLGSWMIEHWHAMSMNLVQIQLWALFTPLVCLPSWMIHWLFWKFAVFTACAFYQQLQLFQVHNYGILLFNDSQ